MKMKQQMGESVVAEESSQEIDLTCGQMLDLDVNERVTEENPAKNNQAQKPSQDMLALI
jgi:hypothetical protein